MAAIFVRTRTRLTQPDNADGHGTSVRTWQESAVVIRLDEDTGTTVHDVYDGDGGLCLLVGNTVDGHKAKDLYGTYRRRGLPAVAQLDGDFVILLHDRASGEI